MPTMTDLAQPECDPVKCGPRPAMPVGTCADGSPAGLTGRCLLNPDGACSWEIRECAPTGCYGICVPDAPQTGCQANSDCPMGQMCDVICREWSCTAGSGGNMGSPTPTTDPATGATTPPVPPAGCACDLDDGSCMCDAAGNCKGRTCIGQCVPATPTCDPMKPVACPTLAALCPDGSPPKPTGTVDPNTCCETFYCPVCAVMTTTNLPRSCAAPACLCAKQTGTDPASCCPTYECTMPLADGSCPRG
jgi:hypothetical protein